MDYGNYDTKKEYMHQYWLDHKDQRKVYVSNWCKINKDWYKEYFKKYTKNYRLKNKDKVKRWTFNYVSRNRDKINKQKHIYYISHRKAFIEAKKAYFIELKGGKCQRCNAVLPLVCYDFHHLDPSTKKERSINWLQEDILLKEEMSKCIILCSNCHRILHFGDKNVV